MDPCLTVWELLTVPISYSVKSSSVLCTKAISPGFSRPLNEMFCVLDGRCLGCACLGDEVNTFPVAVLNLAGS